MLVSSSAISSIVVTPSDSTRVDCDKLYIGGTGAVSIKHSATAPAVVYSAVPVGTVLDVKLTDGRVMAATTATLIVAMSI